MKLSNYIHLQKCNHHPVPRHSQNLHIQTSLCVPVNIALVSVPWALPPALRSPYILLGFFPPHQTPFSAYWGQPAAIPLLSVSLQVVEQALYLVVETTRRYTGSYVEYRPH